MYQSQYFVDKTTDTFADTLLAYGVASLLDRLLRDNVGRRSVRITDTGSVFALNLEVPIEEGFEELDWFCDLPFIETRSKKPPDGWLGQVVNYDHQRNRNADYFAARKQLSKEALRPGATVDEFPELATVSALKPRPDWQIIAQINQMQSITAYSQVLDAWFECKDCFGELLRALLVLFATTPNNHEAAMLAWKLLKKDRGLQAKDTATPVQVLNPAMGKGLNRVKADGANRLGNPDSFWPLEFLKFWGMRVAGIPRVVQTPQGGGRGPRDRKTYVLHPVNLSLSTHEKVYQAFNEGMWAATAVKMDVLAALRYTDTYLAQWLAGQLDDARWGEDPGNHVSGLTAAFYKDMGSAVALLNLSEIALPRWMVVSGKAAGQKYRELLEEHRRVVSSLSERNADEYRLLNSYRDFLSGHTLAPFFEFCGAYSALVMSRMERGQWAPRFLTTNLEVLIVEHDRKLTPILESPGFQNIARAIRLSTVRPQFFKAKNKKGPYDVRYGLGTDLLRKATYPDRFIQALAEFMFAYNQENAQIHERYKGNPPVRRANITTEDIAQVTELIDDYDSQTVGNLLVAYGYAREPRETDDQDTGSGSDTGADSGEDDPDVD